MLDKVFDSFKDHFTQRARNPLLATIFIVWTFKNWRLVYGLFTFDEKATQADKLSYIEKYFNEFGFYQILGESILYAFGVLVVTYFLLAISRAFVDFYENVILPRIKRLTDHKAIVIKEKYDAAMQNLEIIEGKYILERDARTKAQTERDNFEKNNKDLIADITQVTKNYEDSVNNITRLNNNIKELEAFKSRYINPETGEDTLITLAAKYDNLREKLSALVEKDFSLELEYKEINALFNVLLINQVHLIMGIESPLLETEKKIINTLTESNLVDNYLTTCSLIIKRIGIENDEHTEKFCQLGLMKEIFSPVHPDVIKFELTLDGKLIYKILLTNKQIIVQN